MSIIGTNNYRTVEVRRCLRQRRNGVLALRKVLPVLSALDVEISLE